MTKPDEKARPSPMDAYKHIVTNYLPAHGRPKDWPHLTWQGTSRQWALDGQGIERCELIEEIRYHAPCFGPTTLSSALTRLKRQADNDKDKECGQRAQRLSARKGEEDDTHLRMWLQALTGEPTDTQAGEANVWAMKQWLWQVLRHAWNLSVEWQVMPVIYSRAQATGKTKLIELLTSPWADSRRTLRSVNLQDQFYVNILGHTLIGIMDEFAGSGDAERLAAFKSLVTAKTLMARQPHRGDGIEMANRLSLIGSSNLLPPHGVKDEGGGRRIWSIHASEKNIRHDKDRMDLADAVNPDKIYQAVSVDTECLHSTVPEAVLRYMDHVRQQEGRHLGPLEGWYHYWTVEAPGRDLPLREARPSINRYASENGHPRPEGAYDVIAKQLEAYGAKVPSTGRQWPIRNRRLAEGEGSGLPQQINVVRS